MCVYVYISSGYIKGQKATSEVQLGCRHELQTLSKSDPDLPRDEEESEENETGEGHVPLELFAEVTCQVHMYLVYMVANTKDEGNIT